MMLCCSLASACGEQGRRGVEVIADEAIEPSVVRFVAQRDGIDEARARASVVDTLRLVAARRAELSARPGEPEPELPAVRVRQLERAALARLWLRTVFEPNHRARDIPDDDPLLVRARAPGRFIHPRLHVVCQVVAVPEDKTLAPDDRQWFSRAHALLAPVIEHARAYVPVADADACKLFSQLLVFERTLDAGIKLQWESGGFDLDACAETRTDGSCARPQFDPAWVEPVRAAPAPSFVPPFETRFGVHLVLLREILPARTLEQADTPAHLREQVHLEWQTRAFSRMLEELRTLAGVRLASTLGDDARHDADAARVRQD